MSALEILLTLSEYLAVDSITLHADRCLNARHKGAGCNLCAEVCPADEAITVTHGRPALNTEACMACGLCLHRCPTGAYTRPDPLSGKLAKTITALPSGPVDLLCPVHSAPEHGPAPQAVQTKRCLAALAPATLLELAAQGREVWLDDTFCAQCLLAKVHPALTQTVDETNGWIGLLTNAIPVSLRSRQPDPPPPEKRSVVEADRPPVSRRGFLRALAQPKPQNSPGAMETVTPTQPQEPLPVSQRLPHNVPRQRAGILSILDRVMAETDTQADPPPAVAPSPNTLPIADVRIENDKCSACNLCARFCPTGALVFLADDNRFALSFDSRLCLGDACGICGVACPENAVSLQPAAVRLDVVNKKRRYLAAGDFTTCEKCGATIAAGPEHPEKCFVCRLNATQNTLLTALFGPKNPI